MDNLKLLYYRCLLTSLEKQKNTRINYNKESFIVLGVGFGLFLMKSSWELSILSETIEKFV